MTGSDPECRIPTYHEELEPERDGGIMANRDYKKDVKKKKKADAAPAAGAKVLKTVVAQPEVITKKKGEK